MISEFNKFKQSLTASGKNPQPIISYLLCSGQMTEDQFKQLGEQAKGLMTFLK